MTIAGFGCIGWVDFRSLVAPTGQDDPHAALLQLLGEKVPRNQEARADALLAAIERLEPRRLGLPLYALVQTLAVVAPLWSTDTRAPRQPLEADRALALLGRTAGGIFLASRLPRLAVGEWLGRVHVWFTPIAGEKP